MIVGSYASGLYGEPRFTNDVDIVVAYAAGDVPRITEALGEDYYSSETMLSEGLTQGTMANVIHLGTMVKIDLCPLRDTDYDRQSLRRRVRTELAGAAVWVQTAEDTILSKLLWARDTGSELQLGDVRGILSVQERLDLPYLRLWAARLGVAEQLEQLLAETQHEGG